MISTLFWKLFQCSDRNASRPVVEKLALYFGYGRGGHFLRFKNGYATKKPDNQGLGFSWSYELMDGGLLKNRKVPDQPDGRVHMICGSRPLWFAFVWWDRSGDKRPGSNSGFYVRGFAKDFKHGMGRTAARALIIPESLRAFEYAQSVWPDVTERQRFPLVLQPMIEG